MLKQKIAIRQQPMGSETATTLYVGESHSENTLSLSCVTVSIIQLAPVK